MSDWNEALCYHDVRNPNHVEYLGEDDEDPRQPGCSCDNCFYGRDKLALTGTALEAERDALRAAVRTHNANAKTACEARAGWCDAWTDRELRCPDCPRHYEIEEPTP